MTRGTRRQGGHRPPAPTSPRPGNGEPNRFSLSQALLHVLPPHDRAELADLESTGFGGPWILVGDLETPSQQRQRRYFDLHRKAEAELRVRLARGEYMASGYDPRHPIDAPRVKILSDRWHYLEFDFSTSAASGDGIRIAAIEVSVAGGLRLSPSGRRASLAARSLDLSQRSYDLLLMLAMAVRDGEPLVPLRTLNERLFTRNSDVKALGQGIKKLKDHLVRSGVSRRDANQLIQNDRGRGYFLNLPPAEVEILE